MNTRDDMNLILSNNSSTNQTHNLKPFHRENPRLGDNTLRNAYMRQYTSTRMLIAIPSVLVLNWEQPKCPSRVEQKDKAVSHL